MTVAMCPNSHAWLADRGKFVRALDNYQRLASACFAKVEPHLRHDLLRLPYTHLIMCCSNPVNVGDAPNQSGPG